MKILWAYYVQILYTLKFPNTASEIRVVAVFGTVDL
jgi:hypothetical protein